MVFTLAQFRSVPPANNMPTYERSYGALGEYSLSSGADEETIGMKEVLSRRAGASWRLLKLGASAGALAFVSAYTGSHVRINVSFIT